MANFSGTVTGCIHNRKYYFDLDGNGYVLDSNPASSFEEYYDTAYDGTGTLHTVKYKIVNEASPSGNEHQADFHVRAFPPAITAINITTSHNAIGNGVSTVDIGASLDVDGQTVAYTWVIKNPSNADVTTTYLGANHNLSSYSGIGTFPTTGT